MLKDKNHIQTSFVLLDTKRCEACWECIENCTNEVIQKIDLPFHRHAVITDATRCTGCYNCVSVCKNNAFSIIDNKEILKTEKRVEKIYINFLVNNFLIITSLIMILSGFVLQVGFHMGSHGPENNSIQSNAVNYEQIREIEPDKTVFGFDYYSWSAIHKFIIVLFSLLIIYHSFLHWKWYKMVFTKHLLGKNGITIILSALMILVAFTGFIPWIIDTFGGSAAARMLLIEIHDKLTLIFTVFVIIHFLKKVKWFNTAYLSFKRGIH